MFKEVGARLNVSEGLVLKQYMKNKTIIVILSLVVISFLFG